MIYFKEELGKGITVFELPSIMNMFGRYQIAIPSETLQKLDIYMNRAAIKGFKM